MAIICPDCGAEFDVTLFTFGRAVRCDCGAWVDLDVGHRQAAEKREQESPRPPEPLSADDHEDFVQYLNDRFCGFTGS